MSAIETEPLPPLLAVPTEVTEHWVRTTFIRFYADTLLASEDRVELTVASNRNPEKLRVLGLPAALRGQDLQDLLIRMFRLPATHTFEDMGFRVFLSYSLKLAGRPIPDQMSLADLAHDEPALHEPTGGLTFWTRMVYQELRRQGAYTPKSDEEARERELAHAGAVDAYEAIYNRAWRAALTDLCPPDTR